MENSPKQSTQTVDEKEKTVSVEEPKPKVQMADCEVQVDNLEPSAPIVPRDSTASLNVDKV